MTTTNKKLLALLARYTTNPYLSAIRDGLTLTLPIIVAGTIALLINTFPFEPYQEMMQNIFGSNWKLFGTYISTGTFGIISIIMALSIGHSLAEDYNSRHPLERVTPAIVSFLTFSCLVCTMEPVNEQGMFFELRWMGVHGLLLAIITSLLACSLFRLLFSFECLRLNVYSSSNRVSINQSLGAMLPAALTIFIFASIKVFAWQHGYTNPNEWIYTHLNIPFSAFDGQSLTAGSVYGVVRHILWFFGIHGSNVLEPIMQEVYVTALHANVILKQAGIPDPREISSFLENVTSTSSPYAILTKPFFDCYTSIGGAGATTGLLIANLLAHKDTSARKVAKISIVPCVFNINEILLFGLPVVLNPIYLIPFVIIPVIATAVAYYATLWGFVPATTQEVAWNIPIFFSGYIATGSFAGSFLQGINLAISIAVYLPFVHIDNQLREANFKEDFARVIKAAESREPFVAARARLVSRPYPIGPLATNLALDLRQALKKHEMHMEYQPQVNSDTGKVYGVESLMRWEHGTIGEIPPQLFIHLAEDIGYIQELGFWALETSIRQLADWRNRGIDEIVVSINVSIAQLEDESLPDKIAQLLEKYRVPKHSIKLELTETLALTSHMAQNKSLARLHEMGISLAIDDFGMGHSSITYLKKFPVSSLKVDAILSKDILENRSSCEIVSSIADLCRTLNIDLIVEFVETEEHLLKLRELGCSKIQGFYYSPPLNPSQCISYMLQTHKAFGPSTSSIS